MRHQPGGFPLAEEWKGGRYIEESEWISLHLDVGYFQQDDELSFQSLPLSGGSYDDWSGLSSGS